MDRLLVLVLRTPPTTTTQSNRESILKSILYATVHRFQKKNSTYYLILKFSFFSRHQSKSSISMMEYGIVAWMTFDAIVLIETDMMINDIHAAAIDHTLE